VLTDAWPLFALTIETERLTLRLPRDEEVARLGQVAADGLHDPADRPFLTPWTEGGPQARARFVLQGHWASLGEWRPDDWALGLAVFPKDGSEGGAIGRVTLWARDFAVVREVTTSSWLGLEHHGRGIGTEARAGALALAFDHLGAVAALTEVFQDNHASQGVSRKLGYVHDGISRDARGEEALVSDRLRLTADAWRERKSERSAVTVSGVEQCLAEFGLRGPEA
jgi:RimJ/RimL family protein N-acetyltransferase